jgi:hypothetical protein
VGGTGHFSFSDAPFVMPSTITRFGGSIIAGPRGLLIITSAIRVFVDQSATSPDRRLADLTQRFPELTVEAVTSGSTTH